MGQRRLRRPGGTEESDEPELGQQLRVWQACGPGRIDTCRAGVGLARDAEAVARIGHSPRQPRVKALSNRKGGCRSTEVN